MERYGFVEISPLTIMGLTSKGIDGVENELIVAKGWNVDPNESAIRDEIKKLQTYSDIVDLDNELRNQGGLQGFINSTITDGFTDWGSDREEREDRTDREDKEDKEDREDREDKEDIEDQEDQENREHRADQEDQEDQENIA